MLTTALLIVVDFVFLSPLVPEWIVLASLMALIPLPTLLFAKPVEAEISNADLQPFAPDPDNDKVIIVSGWNQDELSKALDDFTGQNMSGRPTRIAIHERFENLYYLTFPEDISVFNFVAMVNYLNYPIDIGSPERKIAVAGKTTLDSAFAHLPDSCRGESAIFYVPDNDEDYDLVHMQSETGVTFAISFNQGRGWRRVDDPRLPAEVKALTLLSEPERVS